MVFQGRARWFKYSWLLSVAAVVMFTACGMITDKDRIKIAKLQDVDPVTGQTYDRYITRGELAKIIREMPDDERPIINNKGDLLRVLKGYIDEQIKMPLAQSVAAEVEAMGKQLVSRQQAQQAYFAKHAEDNLEAIYNLQDPKSVGMTQEEFEGQKEIIELGIDQEYNKLQAQQALTYQAAKDFKEGALVLADEDYEREFSVRKSELKTLEWVKFRAIRFPVTMPNATALAADTRSRINNGESFYDVYNEFKAKTVDFVMESEIQNNPNLAKFEGFWRNAAGCKAGDILGPVYLPEHQVLGEPDAQGMARYVEKPAAYLVLEVLHHQDEAPMTLEEAKPTITPSILVAKEMDKLRKDRGVEIFEDKLPDPNMFSRQMNNGKVQF